MTSADHDASRPRATIPGPEEGARALSPQNVRRRVLLLLLLVGASAWLLWRRPETHTAATSPTTTTFTGRSMGTTWSVKLGEVGPPSVDVQAGVQTQLDAIEGLMSTWSPQTEVSRFNRAETLEVQPLSPPTIEVLRIALDVSRRTQGAFDITVGPLIRAWGFNQGRHDGPWHPPTKTDIEQAAARVDHRQLTLHAEGLSKSLPTLELDLSAVAKGYAVDRVAQWLEQSGIHNYMVEVGGEVRTSGRNAEGDVWRIGIEQPDAGQVAVAQVITMASGALATSGTYRNFIDQDGRRYAHILDPRTSQPVTHQTVSVSVFHEACAWADAWATALLVLGADEGMALAEREGLAVRFVIERDNGTRDVRMTPSFRSRLSAPTAP